MSPLMAWLMISGAAAAQRDRPLVEACVKSLHANSEIQNVAIEYRNEAGADAAWTANLRVEYQERRSGDREWDTWVMTLAAATVDGQTVLSRGDGPYNPERGCPGP